MSRDRYVILGLGRSRSTWFGNVSLWTTSGAVPAEFHKCLSANHVRQRLSSLQPHSALLVEDGIAEIDRDLIESASRAGTPTIVISHNSDSHAQNWLELGAAAVLPAELTPAVLLQTLATNAQTIGTTQLDESSKFVEQLATRQGHFIAVCGPGGTGASTVAIATAQALSADVTQADHILLADFARNGEQAMLHDSPDIVPGVEEAVELHRHRRATTEQIRDLTFGVERRGYRLLLGQRRLASWTALPPAAVQATIAGLRNAFRTVVADITADFESEAEGGSLDVEERNALALASISQADLVLVVGSPGLKGIHSLTRTMRNIVKASVSEARVVPVINRAPKRSTERAEITKTLALLGTSGSPAMTWNAPIFLPDRNVESALREGDLLDKKIAAPLGIAVEALIPQLAGEGQASTTPARITPGSLRQSLDQTAGN